MIQNTLGRRHDTGDMIQKTSYKRHDTRDMIQETGATLSQLITKHSDTQHFSNRNVCDRSLRKSVCNESQNCLFLF